MGVSHLLFLAFVFRAPVFVVDCEFACCFASVSGCASEALLGGRVRGRDEDDLYEEGKLDQRLPGT